MDLSYALELEKKTWLWIPELSEEDKQRALEAYKSMSPKELELQVLANEQFVITMSHLDRAARRT